MVRDSIIVSLLLGAGASVVDAMPRPQFWRRQEFPTFPGFSAFPYPTQTPTGLSAPPLPPPGSLPPPPGSSLPVGPASSGFSFSMPVNISTFPAGPTGSGRGCARGTGSSIAVVPSISGPAPIFPSGTGISYPAGTGSAPAAPSISNSPPIIHSSDAVDSLAASGSAALSASGSDLAVASASAVVGSSSVAVGPVSSSAVASSASAAASSASSVTVSSGCTFTDADTAIASKGSCSNIVLSGITVPAGKTLDMTDLNDGTTVTFEGTTTFEYEAWDGPLLSFSGSGITITGSSGHVLDGNGAKWWDGEGSNGGVDKPNFFYAHDLTDSTISGLNILNTPVQCFSVDGAKNLHIKDVTIDDSAGDTEGGHNTDCFDIGESTGVYLSGITCKNQDDCIAINSGTDISFTGGTCSGSHGLSIGSVGGRDDNTVENIYIASSTVSDGENGVRIKCNSGTTGSVKNVTFADIKMSGITDFGIVIEQDYENGDPTGDPTAGVPITDVTLQGITGSVSDDAQAYYILCAACDDWTVSGVDVTGGSESSKCEGVPSGASSLC